MKGLFAQLARQNIFTCLGYAQSKNQFEYFRIAVALFAIFSFSSFLVDRETFLLPDAIINWEVTNANSFWFELHLKKVSDSLGVGAVTVFWVSAVLYLLSLSLLGLGVHTRPAAITSFAFFLVFSTQLYPFLYGVDLYQSVFMLFLCVFPSGHSVSLLPKNQTAATVEQQRIGIRGIQLYLALTYFSAGFGKAKMDAWLNGEFLFLSLSDPNYHLIDFPTDLPATFYAFSGVLVVTAELLYFLLILIPYVRSILVMVIMSMHLFISLFMGLTPFGILLILANLVAWYPLIIKDARILFRNRKRNEMAVQGFRYSLPAFPVLRDPRASSEQGAALIVHNGGDDGGVFLDKQDKQPL